MDAIRVLNLSKAYKVYSTRFARLKEWLLPFSKPRYALKWVLQDINFAIKPGEAVGIVGVNGAGKSTLLKMLTGTTQPTTGSMQICGRVAALLELGIGFHPEFTGRQNAFMTGQLLGYGRDEITRNMPGIESFAAIGEYIDQPVRVYSSGMLSRLAFAVATAIKPDILIVDEALSVGDMAFQAKCMQRMKALLESGVTILFVSHALNQVRQFCNKAIYISEGRVKAFGSTSNVCDQYQNDYIGNRHKIASDRLEASEIVGDIDRQNPLRANSVDALPGNMALMFTAFDLFNREGWPISYATPGERIVFRASIRATTDTPAGAVVGLLIADKTGYPLLSCNSNYYGVRLPQMREGGCVVMTWSLLWPFYSGEVRVDIGIKPDPFSVDFYDRVFCAKTLVSNTPIALVREGFGGLLHVDAVVEVSISQV